MVSSRTTTRGRGALSPTALLLSLLPALPVHAGPSECSALIPTILRHRVLDSFGFCSLPVDDTVNPRPVDFSPWTNVPTCEVSATDPSKKYCVYTNSRHGRRGLSILTTPEIAADNAGILDEYLNLTSPNDEPFKIVDIPGKGKGVVATRHIKRYETIMSEYSVLLIDMAFAKDVPARRGYRLLHAAVNGLSDPDSVRTLGMTNGLAKDPIENVLRTNGFHTLMGGEQHMALYPVVSRINHGCKPNAYTRFSPKSLQLVAVSAARDIQPGEEITHSYIPLGQIHSARTSALALWSFTCTCPLCSASPSSIRATDARLLEIDSLRDAAITAFQTGKAYTALRLTRQIINLLPREELFPLYAEQYENMARIYWTLGQKGEAEKWAKLSLETLVEQGYLERVRPEYLERMWQRFGEEEGGGG